MLSGLSINMVGQLGQMDGTVSGVCCGATWDTGLLGISPTILINGIGPGQQWSLSVSINYSVTATLSNNFCCVTELPFPAQCAPYLTDNCPDDVHCVEEGM